MSRLGLIAITLLCGDDAQDRSIPAFAGERRSASASGATISDHPRVRGGEEYMHDWFDHQAGPSPRVRGREEVRLEVAVHRPAIPARGGEEPTASRWKK
jgi:hypothetical protein